MVYILNIQLGRCRAVSVHVGDVEVNFRPRNNKMSGSVSTDGWVGDTVGLLAVIIVSSQPPILRSFRPVLGQNMYNSHNTIGHHFLSYA